MRARRSPNRERGIASVEFAVSVGVVLLLMLATAEIGRIFFSYNTLTKAVRNGARHLSDGLLNGAGVIDPTATETILRIAEARNLVVDNTLNGSGTPVLPDFGTGDVTVSTDTDAGAFKPYVRVHAQYEYEPMLGTFSAFGFGAPIDLGFTMTAATTMRVQR